MAKTQVKKGLKIGVPATYSIGVQGCIHKKMAEQLSDMRIFTRSSEDDLPVTTLVGTVQDQAELLGLLNHLYDMHLPLLFVKFLPRQRRKGGDLTQGFEKTF